MKKPVFELTNEQRKYLGLQPLEDHWELVMINDLFLYFDGDTIRKEISVNEDAYFEKELNEKTNDNRTILLPKTAKGKPKKLNFTATSSFSASGVYFSYSKGNVTIANFTTQTSFHTERLERGGDIETLKGWLKKWIAETTDGDFKELQAFAAATRKHCKFKEGDFFAFKFDRRNYAFGRILIDVSSRRKAAGFKENKNYGLSQLMGRALIVKVYHTISPSPDIDIRELSQAMALPSQAVMDNQFYYGEKFIIGHQPLKSSEMDMLMSYSQSISAYEKNCVYLQYGFIFKETAITVFDKYLRMDDEKLYLGYIENPFRKEGIGFGLDTEKLSACIAAKSNKPYWESNHRYDIKYDLRNPANLDKRREIFEAFGLDADKTYAQNLKLAE